MYSIEMKYSPSTAPELEDLDDVRVREARRELRLLDEHLDEGRVVRQVRQDALDDERALEPLRTLHTSLVDVSHTAAPDALEQRVFAELDRLGELHRHGGEPAGSAGSGPGAGRDQSRAIYDSDPVQASQIAPDENRSPIAVLVIGGLDPAGGAGIVRDTLTAVAHGARPIVVGTAQMNKGQKVHRVEARDAEALRDSVRQALAANPAAVKVGMVPNSASAKAVLDGLRNPGGPLVIDPVLASSRGRALFDGPPGDLMPLLARATLVTPNAVEAAALKATRVEDSEGAGAAASALVARGLSTVLVKGGHLRASDDAVTDTLLEGSELHRLSHPRVPGGDARGTGCALATAIAVRLGRGAAVRAACVGAAVARPRARRGGRRRRRAPSRLSAD